MILGFLLLKRSPVTSILCCTYNTLPLSLSLSPSLPSRIPPEQVPPLFPFFDLHEELPCTLCCHHWSVFVCLHTLIMIMFMSTFMLIHK